MNSVAAAPAGEVVIDVDDLGRRFGELEAVRGVTFQVGEGEVFGFLGPNGAGKTTTINMLCTLLRPNSGTASIAGLDTVRQERAVRRSIGLVFQQPTLDEALTAEQNLRFHAYAYGLEADVREQQVRRLLTMVELWERRGDDVRTFSGGMRRRLEIARGLLHQPRVLFLDEPTLGLDPQTRRRIWEYLDELRATDGLTIFLTTHYMDEAENCDRIAVIDHGEIIALDTPGRLKAAVSGDLITIASPSPNDAAEDVKARHGLDPTIFDDSVTFQVPNGEEFLPGFIRSFQLPLQSISVRRPTLDDVFLELTGHAIREEAGSDEKPKRSSRWGRR
jgi:ABC-2 type transport system ATP-binding protein